MPTLMVRKLAPAAVLATLACTTPQKKEVVESAAEVSDEQRMSTFRATVRVLDDNPEYVDELYSIVREHPKTLYRFFVNAAPDLHSPPIAESLGDLLSRHPQGLEAVFGSTVEASQDEPAARQAIARVVESKAGVVADIQTDRRETVVAAMNATIAAVERKPDAQAGFHQAMRDSAPRVVAILAKDPETLRVMAKEMIQEISKDEVALKKVLEGITIPK